MVNKYSDSWTRLGHHFLHCIVHENVELDKNTDHYTYLCVYKVSFTVYTSVHNMCLSICIWVYESQYTI